MRITKIKIQRFLGLRNIELDLNENLQFIAGANNAGKSTILKTIHLFFKSFNEEEIPLEEFVPQNKYYEAEGSRAQTTIRLYFGNLTESEQEHFSDAFQIRNKVFWSEIKISRNYNISFSCSGYADAEYIYDELANLYDIIYIPAVRAGSGGKQSEESRKLFSVASDVLARRRRGKNNQIQSDFSEAVDKVSKQINRLLTESKKAAEASLPSGTDITFKFPTSGEILDLILSKTQMGTRLNTDLTVENEGTGFQSLLSLGLLQYVQSITNNRNLLLLVEEPEAFLHPQFQRSVSDYLNTLSKKSQVITTTHSPVLIDSVPITHTLRLIRDPDGLQYKWNWNEIDGKDILQLTRYCDAKVSEIIFSDKVILCEGITDNNVISLLSNNIVENTLHHKNISVIQGDGTAIKHLSSLLNWFDIDHLIILDKDSYAGERKTLKDICRNKGLPLTDNDYVILDNAMNKNCTSLSDVENIRNKVNQIMKKRKIYILGSDIEGAVIYSYSQQKILKILGQDEFRLLSEDQCINLEKLSYESFHNELNKLIGSKGWNTEKTNKNNKPKPHVLPNFIQTAGFQFRKHSDLLDLHNKLKGFLA